MIKRINRIYSLINLEAAVWIVGILLLAFSDPYSKTHYTLFLPSILFDIPSPGYNLGHSISQFFHGDFVASFNTHPLGIVAVFILLGRSFWIVKQTCIKYIPKGQLNG